jgi:hypothetical protein
MGCYWNMPANYDAGKFESCKANNDEPMGVYKVGNGQTSTWYQGVNPTPAAHPAASSSSCTTFASITASPAKRDRMEKRSGPFEAVITSAPSEL